MWRNRAQLLPFRLEHGMRVEVRALVSLFEPRGDYQLNVEAVRHAGVGNLYEAFLRLKARLEAQGYQIKTFKVSKGQCYEIYGFDKGGQKVEIYFDPQTGAVVASR